MLDLQAPDALPLRLLRDEQAIDAAVGDAAGARDMLLQLAGVVTAGFAAHALTLAATAWPTLGTDAARLGGAWFIASTGGFFAAVSAGLPSCWFYGVVARLRAPAWRLAVELVRVQAVGAVVLLGVLPFWLAGSLALHLVGADVYQDPVWMALTYALPFLAALPGLLGLIRVFGRMRQALHAEGSMPAFLLAAWWVLLFQLTGPATIAALFHALRA